MSPIMWHLHYASTLWFEVYTVPVLQLRDCLNTPSHSSPLSTPQLASSSIFSLALFRPGQAITASNTCCCHYMWGSMALVCSKSLISVQFQYY